MKIAKFEDIKSWQEARKLTARIYALTMDGQFARDFALRDQIRRSAISVMANIAEGFNRKTKKDFTNFLTIALASASETKSHLYIALDLGYIDQQVFDELYEHLSLISKLITGFIQYLLGHRDD
ncbi:MAG: four helix bundle protein [Candidatus Coatesbacteria bacterium]|nr:four helix bundle protein [Candidatus Coatesbacteria bacterium]